MRAKSTKMTTAVPKTTTIIPRNPKARAAKRRLELRKWQEENPKTLEWAKEEQERRKQVRVRDGNPVLCASHKALAYRTVQSLRSRLRRTLFHPTLSPRRFLPLTGCTLARLRREIKQQFTDPMSWDTYAETWTIGYKEPISSFEILEVAEQKRCFYYKNLKPVARKS